MGKGNKNNLTLVETKKSYRRQTRQLINNIIIYLEEQKKSGKQFLALNNVLKLTADITGASLSTLKRIRKEGRKGPIIHTYVSDSCKGRRPPNKIHLTEYDKCIIRRTIHEIYEVDKRSPSINIIHDKLVTKINYKGSKETLRLILKDVGFSFHDTGDTRKKLLENRDIVDARFKYLEYIRNNDALESKKKSIVFFDEVLINPKTETEEKCVVMYAGCSNGLIQKTLGFFLYKSNSKRNEIELDFEAFIKWIKEKLIPSLPLNSLIVMDNAPYHNVQENKRLNPNSTKDELIECLKPYNINLPQELSQTELLAIAKKTQQKYYIDLIFESHGHSILRLPPKHCDLNPMEYIWGQIKNKIATNDSKEHIKTIVTQVVSEISIENWQEAYQKVKDLEEEYWRRDLAELERRQQQADPFEFVKVKCEPMDIEEEEEEMSSESEDSSSDSDY